MRFKLFIFATALNLLITSGDAFAHAQLATATPQPDGVTNAPPTQVSIEYTGELEPKLSSIKVQDANGATVDNGDGQVDAKDGRRLTVGLKPLQPGTYQVTWEATGTDLHKTHGTYAFTVTAGAQAKQGSISISNAWSRAMPSAQSPAVVYLVISDTGEPDRLTGSSTPVAEKAQLHESAMEAGIMRMRPVTDLAITRDRPVTLAPGGYHMMLTGMKQQLKAGGTFPLTLRFEHAGAVSTVVTVQGAAGKESDMGDMKGMDMGRMSH